MDAWPYSSNQNFSDNIRRAAANVNWSSSTMHNNNNNQGNYYDNMISEFNQFSLSGSRVRNNPLNTNPFNGTLPNSGLRDTRINPVSMMQREMLFNEYLADSNLNGSYYNQDLGYGGYNSYGFDNNRSFGGFDNRSFDGYGREDEYITRSMPRVRNGNGSSFGRSFDRSRTRLDGTSFHHRVESLNGFRNDALSLASTGLDNGVYGTRKVTNFSSLEELKGKVVTVAMDQQGGRFLLSKIEEGNAEDVEMIFSEIKDRVSDLMVDQFANYVIQKLFDVCNEEQVTKMLLSVVQDDHILLDVCVDMHGTKVMQKLIDSLSTQEQRSILISVLRLITVVLMKSVNGHHVIQSCFKCFPPEDKKQILNVVADNCLEIATDQSGCCVLQQCVIHAEGELRERLVTEITANALILSEHPYGNYVVQHIVGLHIPLVTAEIVARLAGNFVFLSINKHGSNVVEHMLKECPDHINTIITEIITSNNLLTVVQDPYGNYVIQTALAKSKGTVHYKLMTMIQNNYAFLHSHLYGKRVLAKTRTKGSRSFRM